MTSTTRTRRPLLTIAKVAIEGSGDITRYDVMWHGVIIGQVYSALHTVHDYSNKRRYGNDSHVTRWFIESRETRPEPFYSRRDALASLLLTSPRTNVCTESFAAKHAATVR